MFFVLAGVLNADGIGIEASTKISDDIVASMTNRSWKPECPVLLDNLRLITVNYWGFDDNVHTGHMIVHSVLAQELIEIFEEIFNGKFPIERMELVEAYDADDERSMSANNSSCFCFRANTTNPKAVSKHGYGLAVDINPLYNPYYRASDDYIAPVGGRPYLDRTKSYKGMITDADDNVCYQAFKKRGYTWGGHFEGRKDYHHFEKDPKTLGLS